MLNKKYQFTTQVWLYPGMSGWHFVTLPLEIAQEITYFFSHAKKGWGFLPVSVTVGVTTWNTSIFPDKKSSSYLLPLKAAIRKKENITARNEIAITLEICER